MSKAARWLTALWQKLSRPAPSAGGLLYRLHSH